MPKEYVLLLFIVVVSLLVGTGIYNNLVRGRNATLSSFAQIDVQLRRRYDLIPNLVAVAKRFLEHEAGTLEAVIAARARATGAVDAAKANPANRTALANLATADGGLGVALGRLMVLTEAYPDLKADATMASLSEEIRTTENLVSFARQAYNDHVEGFNNLVQMFPNNLVALVCRFRALPILESTEDAGQRATPKVAF